MTRILTRLADHSRLRPASVLVVSAPHRSDSGLRSDLAALFPHAHLRMVRPAHVNQAVISAYARSVIPTRYLALALPKWFRDMTRLGA